MYSSTDLYAKFYSGPIGLKPWYIKNMKDLLKIAFLTAILLSVNSLAFCNGLDNSVENMVQELFDGWPKAERNSRTAVLPFFVEDGDDVTTFGTYLAETVTDTLVARHQCPVVSRTRLKNLMEELEFQQEDIVSEGTRQNIGEFTGAQLMIIGTIWNLGSSVKISARLYSLETAYALAAASCFVAKEAVPPAFRDEMVIKRPKVGEVKFSSNPPGAKVFCYDLPKRYIGKTTEEFERQLPAKTYRFKFQLVGYRSEVRTLEVEAGQDYVLAIDLKQQEGTVELSAKPEEAQLFLNGSAAVRGITSLPAGIHVFSVSCPGYRQQSQKFTLEDGEHLPLSMNLSPVGSLLTLEVEPADSIVAIEGVIVPSEKLSKVALEPGNYMIEVEKPGWQKRIEEITLADGESRTMLVSLSKELVNNPPASPERIVSVDIPEDEPVEPTPTPAPTPSPTPTPSYRRSYYPRQQASSRPAKRMTVFLEFQRFTMNKIRDISVTVDGRMATGLVFTGERAATAGGGKLTRIYRFTMDLTPGSHSVVVRGRTTSGPFSRSFRRNDRLFVPRGQVSSVTLYFGLVTPL